MFGFFTLPLIAIASYKDLHYVCMISNYVQKERMAFVRLHTSFPVRKLVNY